MADVFKIFLFVTGNDSGNDAVSVISVNVKKIHLCYSRPYSQNFFDITFRINHFHSCLFGRD